MGLERPEKIKENSITLKEIAELEEPIKKIIEKLQTRIEKGEYSLIIGDDVSGRIPTIILGGVIKRIYKLKGVRDPNIVFIPGGLSRNDKLSAQLQNYISKYGVEKGDKVLVVTETIQSGYALSVLSETLTTLGYKCDIATMGIEQLDDDYQRERRKENLGDTNIVSGEFTLKDVNFKGMIISPHTPLVYRDKRISGVYKRRDNSTSRPMISKESDNFYSLHSLEDQIKIQEKINKSRAEATILVNKLVEWYLSQDKEKKSKME